MEEKKSWQVESAVNEYVAGKIKDGVWVQMPRYIFDKEKVKDLH